MNNDAVRNAVFWKTMLRVFEVYMIPRGLKSTISNILDLCLWMCLLQTGTCTLQGRGTSLYPKKKLGGELP